MTKPKQKSESFGPHGCKIRLIQRTPGGPLTLVWLEKTGDGYKQRWESLGHSDWKEGRKLAQQLVDSLTLGALPRREQPVLTLEEGIARALDPITGKYATESRHVTQTRQLLEKAVKRLGKHLSWADLTPARVLGLARQMARESRDGKGVRSAEYTCQMLYAVAEWLRENQLIPDGAARPGRNWKERLKNDWVEITGRRVETKRPRHTENEVQLLFAALPKADPRLRLLMELAAELRSGQAVRARRSDLELGPVGAFQLGRFAVHGRGKKRGEVVDLTPELRSLVDEVLDQGYLAEPEAAYQASGEDYFLFPARKLKQGRATAEQCRRQPLGPTALGKMFRTLEEEAGVAHIEGRAFYGLRRTFTDLAPEFADDARVLNRLTGHVDSRMRERVYQDRENEKVLAEAARARRAMRRAVAGGGTARAA